jgi:hypothetical protein
MDSQSHLFMERETRNMNATSYLLKGNDLPEKLMPQEEFYQQMRKLIPKTSKLFRLTISHWGSFWRSGWYPADAVIELVQMWS